MRDKKETKKDQSFTFFKAFLKSLITNPFWKNKLNLEFVLASLFFNILVWILFAIFIKPSEFPIPLHYNIYFGIDLTGSYKNVYHLPAVGLFVWLANLTLALWFYLRNRILSYILLLGSLAVQIFVLIGAITVIYINR